MIYQALNFMLDIIKNQLVLGAICDKILGMNKILLPLMVMVLALAGCRTASNDVEYVEPTAVCAGGVVEYSMPNGNDLLLETKSHVVHVTAQPNKQYEYRVWTGDKPTTDNPDLIVNPDGSSMVLVSE